MAEITLLEMETRRLQEDIDSLKSQLDGMRRTGEGMMTGVNAMNSMWEGRAKEAFIAQFQSDYQLLSDMMDIIKEMINNLEYAKQQYDMCENSVASVISAIRV